jgi:hypothetical protein
MTKSLKNKIENQFLRVINRIHRIIDEKPPEGVIELMTCDTLDKYWMNISDGVLNKVDMFILDVEGGELEVFKGSLATFELSPNLIMMAECTSNLDNIQALLPIKGFKFFKWNNASSMLKEIFMQLGNILVVRQNITSNA